MRFSQYFSAYKSRIVWWRVWWRIFCLGLPCLRMVTRIVLCLMLWVFHPFLCNFEIFLSFLHLVSAYVLICAQKAMVSLIYLWSFFRYIELWWSPNDSHMYRIGPSVPLHCHWRIARNSMARKLWPTQALLTPSLSLQIRIKAHQSKHGLEPQISQQ